MTLLPFWRLAEFLSHESNRIMDRFLQLPEEINPASTTEFLKDWEVAAGIPDGTRPRSMLTDAQRRVELVRSLFYRDRPSKQNMIDLAAELGYVIEIYNSYQPFVCGVSAAGDYLTNDGEPKPENVEGGWQSTIKITYQSNLYDSELEALLRKYVPSDIEIIFSKTFFESQTAGLDGVDLNGVAYDGSARWCAVGDGGEVWTSDDSGATWTTRTSGTAENIYSVTWGNSLFVAVGANGIIVTSPDGETWTTRTPATADDYYSVTYDGSLSLFCAVGDGGAIQYSVNGTTGWTSGTAAASYVGNFRVVVSNGSVFCAAGTGGEIQTSSDASTWTQRTADAGYTDTFYSGCFSNWGSIGFSAVLVLAGDDGEIQYSSDDGATWASSPISTTEDIHGIDSDDTNIRIWAVGSNGKSFYTSDRSAWTEHEMYENIFVNKTIGIVNDIVSDQSGNWVAVTDGDINTTSILYANYEAV